MKELIALVVLATLLGTARAEGEIEAVGRITSVGLFKNGLAVIRRRVHVSKDGMYLIKDVPEPVHGTFWIESDARVSTRVTKRMFAVPAEDETLSLEDELVGRQITATLRTGLEAVATIKGVVLADSSLGAGRWSRDYEAGRYSSSRPPLQTQTLSTKRLRIQTDSGIVLIDAKEIAFITAELTNDTVQRERPVLIFGVTQTPATGTVIEFCYLTKGLSWMPSYHIDLQGADQLTIRQKAIIKNEYMDLDDAEVFLISGFPNVEFANVTSPLSLQTTWSSFFLQLNQQVPSSQYTFSNRMTQQAVSYNRAGTSGVHVDAPEDGEGVDIHYESIGRQSMKEGDSMAILVASEKTSCERMIEWGISDNRDGDGRYRHHRNAEERDEAWDSICFKNPFAFPMTTAAAMITSGSKFLGQSKSVWVNPKSQTVLHLTKALSVITRDVEHEVPESREQLKSGGHHYRESEVVGNMDLTNHRKTPARVLIRKKFSGELVSADESPVKHLLKEGVCSINQRNELTWEIEIAPGATRKLAYRYSLLVRD